MRLTHTSLKPPFVSRDKPIEGPTVWYGADLAPADVEYRCASLCLERHRCKFFQLYTFLRNISHAQRLALLLWRCACRSAELCMPLQHRLVI